MTEPVAGAQRRPAVRCRVFLQVDGGGTEKALAGQSLFLRSPFFPLFLYREKRRREEGYGGRGTRVLYDNRGTEGTGRNADGNRLGCKDLGRSSR
jgi:hypothetical protein